MCLRVYLSSFKETNIYLSYEAVLIYMLEMAHYSSMSSKVNYYFFFASMKRLIGTADIGFKSLMLLLLRNGTNGYSYIFSNQLKCCSSHTAIRRQQLKFTCLRYT